MWQRENLHLKNWQGMHKFRSLYTVSMVIETKVVIGWYYNFECDWFVELSDNKLSDNKLSDNNLASELVGNRSFLNQSQLRKL